METAFPDAGPGKAAETHFKLQKMKAELTYLCDDTTGEGATWLPGTETLLWVDIEGCRLHEYEPATGRCRLHRFPAMVSTIVPAGPREVILALQGKLVRYRLDDRVATDLCAIEPGRPLLRPNDGKASPEGRIWLGVMHLGDHCETGSLWCIEPDLSCRKVLARQCIPNGIVWNAAGDTMYYVDSGRSCIEAYRYDRPTGHIRLERTAVRVPQRYGVPDGMTIDADDNLWVAHWGGYGVYVWNPANGVLLDKIDVPVPNVASCTFGGKNRDRLFITTARAGLTAGERERYPLSGSLFAADVKTKAGENHYPFAGAPPSGRQP